jgi:DNA-binding NtrC family response regulator
LFLQNLQRLPLPMQKDLVSVLRNTAQGFRLICTSSEDLERLTDEGKFHDELFYRVASLPVMLPPLREHTEDIPALVKHFVAKATNPLFDANLVELSDDALAVLTAHAWPGNVVELGQTVTKVAATTDARVVTSAQLPLRLKELTQWPSLADFLAGHEKQYIDMVLHAARGDKGAAAKVLGVDVSKLG